MNIYKNLSIVSMRSEKWKWIPGYENLYRVSNMGRIKSVSRMRNGGPIGKISNRIRKQGLKNGYPIVSLFKDKPRFNTVHILVAKEFVPNPLNKKEVNNTLGKLLNDVKMELMCKALSGDRTVLHWYDKNVKPTLNNKK